MLFVVVLVVLLRVGPEEGERMGEELWRGASRSAVCASLDVSLQQQQHSERRVPNMASARAASQPDAREKTVTLLRLVRSSGL